MSTENVQDAEHLLKENIGRTLAFYRNERFNGIWSGQKDVLKKMRFIISADLAVRRGDMKDAATLALEGFLLLGVAFSETGLPIYNNFDVAAEEAYKLIHGEGSYEAFMDMLKQRGPYSSDLFASAVKTPKNTVDDILVGIDPEKMSILNSPPERYHVTYMPDGMFPYVSSPTRKIGHFDEFYLEIDMMNLPGARDRRMCPALFGFYCGFDHEKGEGRVYLGRKMNGVDSAVVQMPIPEGATHEKFFDMLHQYFAAEAAAGSFMEICESIAKR